MERLCWKGSEREVGQGANRHGVAEAQARAAIVVEHFHWSVFDDTFSVPHHMAMPRAMRANRCSTTMMSMMIVADEVAMRVSWKQRAWGFALAAAGVAIFVTDRTVSHAMFMCASLLIGWTQAFEPGPSARMPLRDVFDGYRTGRFRPTTLTQKLVTVAGMLLLLAAFVASLKGL